MQFEEVNLTLTILVIAQAFAIIVLAYLLDRRQGGDL